MKKEKVFKIRVENMRDGTVDEYETNCYALATSDKEEEGEDICVNAPSEAVNSTAYEMAGCAMALENIVKTIKDKLHELAASEEVNA